MFTLYPLVVYVILENRSYGASFLGWYSGYIGSFDFIGGTGALWFLFALLIFTAVYGLGRWVFEKLRWSLPAPKLSTGPRGVVALILIIAISTFLVRIVQPVGTSFYNMMLCNFSQYIVLFVVGILAYRQDWFSRLDYSMGTRLLWWAPTFGFAVWGAIELLGGAATDPTAVNGGFTWQSATFSLWESFTCIAVSTGLLVLFREKFNRQGQLVKALSGSAFAVYVFHAPIIVAATLLFKSVPWLPGFKFAATVAVCLPVCFAVAHYVVMKIPLLKKVM
jgi:glucans biosynthesis protein C